MATKVESPLERARREFREKQALKQQAHASPLSWSKTLSYQEETERQDSIYEQVPPLHLRF
ncbi:hypothetical protein M1146_03390 [Patescibacteria group bacterium]|nr:hypothetical protein [Patescibacteria group bacterium]